ncbi:hypothetical protein SprV_0602133900 [Sparganum proliferum]
MEEDSEDRRCDLRCQPHCRREGQTRSMQVSAAPTSQCQRTTASNVSTMSADVQAPSGLVGHLRANCTLRAAPAVVSPSTSPPSPMSSTNVDRPPEPPLPPSSSIAVTSAAVESAMPINTTHNPDAPTNTNTTTVNTSDEDRVYSCPHCDRTFTSHIGLLGHLRIHRTETDEPVPGAPAYTRRHRLICLHCPCTFTHCMGLFGHMRIHESGIDRSSRIPSTSGTPTMHSTAHTPPPSAIAATSSITHSTSYTPTMLNPTHTPLPSTPTTTSSNITEADTNTADFS